jgi:hypothetical protein
VNLLRNRQRWGIETLGKDGANQHAIQFLQGHGQDGAKTFAIDEQLTEAIKLTGNIDPPTYTNKLASADEKIGPWAVRRCRRAIERLCIHRHQSRAIVANKAEVEELFRLGAGTDKRPVPMLALNNVVRREPGQRLLDRTQAETYGVGNLLFRRKLVSRQPMPVRHQIQHRSTQPTIARLVTRRKTLQCAA